MKLFRIIGRSIRDSFRSVTRNFSLSMASILCVTITLIIVSVSIVLAANIRYSTKNIENEMNIILYLQKGANEDDLNNVVSEVKSLKHVESYQVITKTEERDNLASYNDTFKTILDYLDENPLLDSIVIYADDISEIQNLASELESIPNVDSVKYNEGIVNQIISVFDIVEKAALGMVVALLLVSVFLIVNTIKLTIYSRQDEIGIMRLVGASNLTIELPFVFEGLIIGIVGSIIPVCVTIYGYVILCNTMGNHLFSDMLPLVKPYYFVFYVSALLIIIGAIVGMYGSLRAVRKYLKI